ncbi:hypothetical protein DID77_01720 [Candidatus Marinamargulisbacteria bacterium SCGC AG-439-L15]|nr:hypothetical protein DID77_01720 [Candidatus Marinamargulisbacteria bacterium SCGC AG-439-L15]
MTVKNDRFKTIKWAQVELAEQDVSQLSKTLKVSPLLSKILLAPLRQTKKKINYRTFLDPPDHYLSSFQNITSKDQLDSALDRLARAVKNKEKVVVNGDSDADGITAATIIVAALRHLGVSVRHDFPIRSREGHGLQVRIIDEAKENGVSLIVTTDCGTKDVEAVAYANTLGIDVLVTDHHILGKNRPEAVAIVNPQLVDKDVPDKYLSGAGVALKLMLGLSKHLDKRYPKPFFEYLVVLSALGTISDRMSLLEPMNRVLVNRGIKALNKATLSGLKALKEICVGSMGVVKPRDISRTIAPRLNAPGRIGDRDKGIPDSNMVVDLLLQGVTDYQESGSQTGLKTYIKHFVKVMTVDTKPKEVALDAEKEAVLVEEVNDQRRKITEKIGAEIETIVTNNSELTREKVIIVRGQNWNSGVIGIDADRLRDRFMRPAIIVTKSGDNPYMKGSIRSIKKVNMYQILESVQEKFQEERNRPLFCAEVDTEDGVKLVSAFGGHAQACGFTMHEENYDWFVASVHSEVAKLPESQFDAQLEYIETVSFNQLNANLLAQLDELGPYGEGFDYPLFCLKGGVIGRQPRPFGNKFQYDKTPHVEFHILEMGSAKKRSKPRRIPALAFGMWEKFQEVVTGNDAHRYDILFSIEENKPRGKGRHKPKSEISLLVHDLRRS